MLHWPEQTEPSGSHVRLMQPYCDGLIKLNLVIHRFDSSNVELIRLNQTTVSDSQVWLIQLCSSSRMYLQMETTLRVQVSVSVQELAAFTRLLQTVLEAVPQTLLQTYFLFADRSPKDSTFASKLKIGTLVLGQNCEVYSV